jgi:hypothetical protein
MNLKDCSAKVWHKATTYAIQFRGLMQPETTSCTLSHIKGSFGMQASLLLLRETLSKTAY